jgi:hypothetical protein
MDWRRRLLEDGPRNNSSPARLNYQRNLSFTTNTQMNRSPCEWMRHQHRSGSTLNRTRKKSFMQNFYRFHLV